MILLLAGATYLVISEPKRETDRQGREAATRSPLASEGKSPKAEQRKPRKPAKEIRHLADQWYQDFVARHPEIAVTYKEVPDGENGFLQLLEFADRYDAAVTLAEFQLAAIGRNLCVDYRRTASSEVRAVAVGADTLIVAGTLDSEQRVARAIQRWLVDLAHVELGRMLTALADRHGFRFERIQIRRQRTRWGSCSASGTISLNVCAMFQSPAVARYLLVHELSHTRHMNHSRRFWSQVEAIEPDYRTLDRELLQGWQRVPGWMFT